MATVVAPPHRHHAFWLRIIEDLGLVFAVAAVGWTLFAVVSLRQNPWRAIPWVQGGGSVPAASAPMPLVAASRPMMAAVAAAMSLEERGIFGTETRAAWQNALAECRRFAARPIVATRGEPVMLWLLEAERERAAELGAMIADPGTRAGDVEALTVLRDEALANAALIERYREIVNFDHWRAVCETEGSPAALEARESAWRAERATEAGRVADAKDAWEASFAAWRQVLDASPALLHDPLVVEELGGQIDHYRGTLAGLGTDLPSGFILQDVVDRAGTPAG